MAFRADGAFAKPEPYEALEKRQVKYVIRPPANGILERNIAALLRRPPSRPGYGPLARCKSFFYRAASWERARRVVAKSLVSPDQSVKLGRKIGAPAKPLVKTGGRLVKHARYYRLLLAESHLRRPLFAGMLRKIPALPAPAGCLGAWATVKWSAAQMGNAAASAEIDRRVAQIRILTPAKPQN
ncbi:MAG: transposase [Deltaproteobacteria bacterium]|nr:transposase [Deltaproteobacteria bacterium]